MSERAPHADEDAALRSMAYHLGQTIGSGRAKRLAEPLGVKGMEAVDALLMAVKSQNATLIQWIYEGIKRGPLGEGAPVSTALHAVALGVSEALQSKPGALSALLRLGQDEPGLVMDARAAAMADYGRETSFVALAIKESVLRRVIAPGRPQTQPSAHESEGARLALEICEAFWSGLSPTEILSVGDDEVVGLTEALAERSYPARDEALLASLAFSQARICQAALDLASQPGAPRRVQRNL